MAVELQARSVLHALLTLTNLNGSIELVRRKHITCNIASYHVMVEVMVEEMVMMMEEIVM